LQFVDDIVNRKILKAESLMLGTIYKLVDIYKLDVNGRVAVVGGLKADEDDVIYVWLPELLLRNVDNKENFVNVLKRGIESNKFLYVVYKGMGTNTFGNKFYDIAWVRNKK
jgi:hypothetical protein